MSDATPTPETLLREALPGPDDIVTRTLPNGLRALARHSASSPAVVFTGALFGGALADPPERPGLASFTAALLERGTEAHTFGALSDELEAIGAEISFGAGRHTTGFDGKCLAEDLPRTLELTAEMMARPAFPHEQVERVRGQILTALQQRDSSTRRRAAMAFRRLAYGNDHPYGRPTSGNADGVEAVTRAEIVRFYRDVLRPTEGIVSVVGAVEPEAALDLLAKTVGQWAPDGTGRAPREVQPPQPPDKTTRDEVDMPDKTQVDIVMGNPAIPRSHPDWLAASLANITLGVFGLMGRLGERVRDEHGLAYYAFSRLSGGLGPGPWYAAAGVNPSNVEPAIDAIRDEMRRLRDEPVPEDELADVRAYVSGSLPLRLETNRGVARALLDLTLYDLGLDYLQRFGGLVDAVTADDIQRAARAHLHPNRLAVGLAGPAQPTTD